MKKYKVVIIADTVNWAFANRAEALHRYCPKDMSIDVIYYSLSDHLDTTSWAYYDLAFVLPTNLILPLLRSFAATNIRVPILASHNSGVGRRHQVLLETLLSADFVVINNYSCWMHGRLNCRPERFIACNISNGVDLTTYYQTTPIEERPHKVLWIGATSKLSAIEDDVKGWNDVLYPLSLLLQHRPEKWEVDFRPVDDGAGMTPDQMRDWYNSGSYLIVASKTEGTPNIALEAAACGCVVVSSRVGNMPELIRNRRNGVLVQERRTGDFFRGLQIARENRSRFSAEMLQDIKSWDWSMRAEWFYALFRRLIDSGAPMPFSYLATDPEEIGNNVEHSPTIYETPDKLMV